MHDTSDLENRQVSDLTAEVDYLAEEMNGPMLIKGLALDVARPPGQLLHNWTIRLKKTELTRLVPSQWENEDLTTVYEGDVSIVSNGWNSFTFHTPFAYDGTNNLLVVVVRMADNDAGMAASSLSANNLTCRPKPTTKLDSILAQHRSLAGCFHA